MKPLVSIITVSFNSEKHIAKTINSVLSQTYSRIEYLIIDGKSSDKTCEIIKEYGSKIDFFLSESDESMYDAINKGLKKSSGELIAILNSDDIYYDENVVEKIVNKFNEEGVDGIYGNIKVDYGNKINVKKVFPVTSYQLLASRKCTFVPHCSFFIRREVINKVGYYDLQYKYASDFDFILRCLTSCNVKYVDFFIAIFRRHSDSLTSSGLIPEERNKIINENIKQYQNIGFFMFLTWIYIWGKYYIKNIYYNIKIKI